MSLSGKFVTVGLATLASRIGGFLRDAMIAALLGTGPVADAVFAAFLLPNLFRRMLTEGAFNAAFIPIFARRNVSGGPASAAAFAGGVLKALLVFLALLLAAALLFMPGIVAFLAGGFRDDPAKFADAVLFSRVSIAYVAAISLTALFSAVLNAVDRFRLAAIAPVLFNLVLVAILGWLLLAGWHNARAAGLTIVALVSLAGLLQLGYIIRVAARHGGIIRFDGRWRDSDVGRFALVVIPGIALAGAGHVNIRRAGALDLGVLGRGGAHAAADGEAAQRQHDRETRDRAGAGTEQAGDHGTSSSGAGG